MCVCVFEHTFRQTDEPMTHAPVNQSEQAQCIIDICAVGHYAQKWNERVPRTKVNGTTIICECTPVCGRSVCQRKMDSITIDRMN